jgi:signal transduction histidine kinase
LSTQHSTFADVLQAQLDELAVLITERQLGAYPELVARYGPQGVRRTHEDARFHLQFLAAALTAGSDRMFLDYIGWAKVTLASRNVDWVLLQEHLGMAADVLTERFGSAAEDAVRLLERSRDELPAMPDDVPTFLDPRMPLWKLAHEYLATLLRGDRREAGRLITEAIARGTAARDIYRQVFEPVQQELGRLWQLNRISVAQEHFCTAATQQVMTQLYGSVFGGEKSERRAVAMSVGGELHEIGLRIITDLLELEGWQTWYLGANVPPQAAIALCVEQRADVLLVSATLPPHIAACAEVVRLFRAEPALAKAKVIVGGRAFRTAPDLWKSIGADGYARDADECLALLKDITAASNRPDERAPAPADETRGETTYELYGELAHLNNELVTAQRELARTVAELQRLNAHKDELLGMAAHDLRNPLSANLAFVTFLLADAEHLSTDNVTLLQRLRSTNAFMLRLVEDVLDFATVQSGKVRLRLAETDLREATATVVETLRIVAGGRNVSIHYDAGTDIPLLHVDRVKIMQAVQNLVANAVSYSPEGGAVDVRLSSNAAHITIEVVDRGPGIPADELPNLFKPFMRLSTSQQTTERGTGLGLAITKRLVEAHHGTLDVQTEVGRGATFTIRLPRTE